MTNWWEMSPSEVANRPEAMRQRAQAYQDVLLVTPMGRYVFADMIRIKEEERVNAVNTNAPHDVSFFLGIDCLIATIRERMGLDVDVADQLAALVPIAARYEPVPNDTIDITGV